MPLEVNEVIGILLLSKVICIGFLVPRDTVSALVLCWTKSLMICWKCFAASSRITWSFPLQCFLQTFCSQSLFPFFSISFYYEQQSADASRNFFLFACLSTSLQLSEHWQFPHWQGHLMNDHLLDDIYYIVVWICPWSPTEQSNTTWHSQV